MIDFTRYVFSRHGFTPVIYQANNGHRYPLHIAVTLFWSYSNLKRLQLFVDHSHSHLSRVALITVFGLLFQSRIRNVYM